MLIKYRLLFMTYNGWVMLAVAVGAFVGYLMFSQSSSTKSVAGHGARIAADGMRRIG